MPFFLKITKFNTDFGDYIPNNTNIFQGKKRAGKTTRP